MKLYASPTGKGSISSRPHPCSLTTAQQAVRALHPASRKHVTVELADGTYDLSHTLKFTAADSGSPGHPVVRKPAPGAHPVLSGAGRVPAGRRLRLPQKCSGSAGQDVIAGVASSCQKGRR